MDSIRLANPEDAPLVAEWLSNNPYITAKTEGIDRIGGSTFTLVLERDGKHLAFIPLKLCLVLPFLSFEKRPVEEMPELLDAIVAAIRQFASSIPVEDVVWFASDRHPLKGAAQRRGFEAIEEQAMSLTVEKNGLE